MIAVIFKKYMEGLLQDLNDVLMGGKNEEKNNDCIDTVIPRCSAEPGQVSV